DLERGALADRVVDDGVDRAHAAAPELALDTPRADLGPDRQRLRIHGCASRAVGVPPSGDRIVQAHERSTSAGAPACSRAAWSCRLGCSHPRTEADARGVAFMLGEASVVKAHDGW